MASVLLSPNVTPCVLPLFKSKVIVAASASAIKGVLIAAPEILPLTST